MSRKVIMRFVGNRQEPEPELMEENKFVQLPSLGKELEEDWKEWMKRVVSKTFAISRRD